MVNGASFNYNDASRTGGREDDGQFRREAVADEGAHGQQRRHRGSTAEGDESSGHHGRERMFDEANDAKGAMMRRDEAPHGQQTSFPRWVPLQEAEEEMAAALGEMEQDVFIEQGGLQSTPSQSVDKPSSFMMHHPPLAAGKELQPTHHSSQPPMFLAAATGSSSGGGGWGAEGDPSNSWNHQNPFQAGNGGQTGGAPTELFHSLDFPSVASATDSPDFGPYFSLGDDGDPFGSPPPFGPFPTPSFPFVSDLSPIGPFLTSPTVPTPIGPSPTSAPGPSASSSYISDTSSTYGTSTTTGSSTGSHGTTSATDSSASSYGTSSASGSSASSDGTSSMTYSSSERTDPSTTPNTSNNASGGATTAITSNLGTTGSVAPTTTALGATTITTGTVSVATSALPSRSRPPSSTMTSTETHTSTRPSASSSVSSVSTLSSGPPTFTSPSAASTSPGIATSKNLSAAAITGIVAGSLLGFVILLAGAFLLRILYRQRMRDLQNREFKGRIDPWSHRFSGGSGSSGNSGGGGSSAGSIRSQRIGTPVMAERNSRGFFMPSPLAVSSAVEDAPSSATRRRGWPTRGDGDDDEAHSPLEIPTDPFHSPTVSESGAASVTRATSMSQAARTSDTWAAADVGAPTSSSATGPQPRSLAVRASMLDPGRGGRGSWYGGQGVNDAVATGTLRDPSVRNSVASAQKGSALNAYADWASRGPLPTASPQHFHDSSGWETEAAAGVAAGAAVGAAAAVAATRPSKDGEHAHDGEALQETSNSDVHGETSQEASTSNHADALDNIPEEDWKAAVAETLARNRATIMSMTSVSSGVPDEDDFYRKIGALLYPDRVAADGSVSESRSSSMPHESVFPGAAGLFTPTPSMRTSGSSLLRGSRTSPINMFDSVVWDGSVLSNVASEDGEISPTTGRWSRSEGSTVSGDDGSIDERWSIWVASQQRRQQPSRWSNTTSSTSTRSNRSYRPSHYYSFLSMGGPSARQSRHERDAILDLPDAEYASDQWAHMMRHHGLLTPVPDMTEPPTDVETGTEGDDGRVSTTPTPAVPLSPFSSANMAETGAAGFGPFRDRLGTQASTSTRATSDASGRRQSGYSSHAGMRTPSLRTSASSSIKERVRNSKDTFGTAAAFYAEERRRSSSATTSSQNSHNPFSDAKAVVGPPASQTSAAPTPTPAALEPVAEMPTPSRTEMEPSPTGSSSSSIYSHSSNHSWSFKSRGSGNESSVGGGSSGGGGGGAGVTRSILRPEDFSRSSPSSSHSRSSSISRMSPAADRERSPPLQHAPRRSVRPSMLDTALDIEEMRGESVPPLNLNLRHLNTPRPSGSSRR